MKIIGFAAAVAVWLGSVALAQQSFGMNLIHHNIASGGNVTFKNSDQHTIVADWNIY